MNAIVKPKVRFRPRVACAPQARQENPVGGRPLQFSHRVVSRHALGAPASDEPVPWYLRNAQHAHGEPRANRVVADSSSLEDVLWDALCDAPDDGADVAELMRMTGLGRSAVYKYLALLAGQGRAVKVGWGRWRAAEPGER